MNIATKRIFFGHQSVGANIIEGINDVLAGNKTAGATRLNMVESRNIHDCNGPCFIHCRVGKNQDPLSKINDFIALMDSGFGDNVDIAGFKFCYVDIQESTDAEQLFDCYREALEYLEKKYQNTMFLHITAPLRTVEPGLRRIAKNLLGKKSIAAAKNLKRQIFNESMVRQYGESGCLFDLARVESTYSNGKRCGGRFSGNDVFSLVPQYTYDGGHLNKRGRQIVAAEFLETLENCSDQFSRPTNLKTAG